jgi:RNA-binding protein with serine-rich domain 1
MVYRLSYCNPGSTLHNMWIEDDTEGGRGRSRDRHHESEHRRSSSFSDFSSPSPSPRHQGEEIKEKDTVVKNKVFIDRLTRNIHEGHLREIFGTYGDLGNIRHHRLRGWAHIEYKNDEGATQAIHCMDGGQIDGNVINVSQFRIFPEHKVRRSVSPRKYH